MVSGEVGEKSAVSLYKSENKGIGRQKLFFD